MDDPSIWTETLNTEKQELSEWNETQKNGKHNTTYSKNPKHMLEQENKINVEFMIEKKNV